MFFENFLILCNRLRIFSKYTRNTSLFTLKHIEIFPYFDYNTIINGNITVSFLEKQKTITLKQTANTISIEILIFSNLIYSL